MKHKIKYWLDKGDLHKAKKMCERYLNNWDIFEQDNTLSFSETPSFWCRKNKVE